MTASETRPTAITPPTVPTTTAMVLFVSDSPDRLGRVSKRLIDASYSQVQGALYLPFLAMAATELAAGLVTLDGGNVGEEELGPTLDPGGLIIGERDDGRVVDEGGNELRDGLEVVPLGVSKVGSLDDDNDGDDDDGDDDAAIADGGEGERDDPGVKVGIRDGDGDRMGDADFGPIIGDMDGEAVFPMLIM